MKYTLEAYWSNGIKKWRKVPKEQLSKDEIKKRVANLTAARVKESTKKIPKLKYNFTDLELALEEFEENLKEVMPHSGNRAKYKVTRVLQIIAEMDAKKEPYVYSSIIKRRFPGEINHTTVGIVLKILKEHGYAIPEEGRDKIAADMKLRDKDLRYVRPTDKIIHVDKVQKALVNGKIHPSMFANYKKKDK